MCACVRVHCAYTLKEFLSAIVLILLFVCALRIWFFWFCLCLNFDSFFLFFSMHTNTLIQSDRQIRFVSFHFLNSIETSITIVLHVIKMLVFHHISSHIWMGETCVQYTLYTQTTTKPSSWFYVHSILFFRVFLLFKLFMYCYAVQTKNMKRPIDRKSFQIFFDVVILQNRCIADFWYLWHYYFRVVYWRSLNLIVFHSY